MVWACNDCFCWQPPKMNRPEKTKTPNNMARRVKESLLFSTVGFEGTLSLRPNQSCQTRTSVKAGDTAGVSSPCRRRPRGNLGTCSCATRCPSRAPPWDGPCQPPGTHSDASGLLGPHHPLQLQLARHQVPGPSRAELAKEGQPEKTNPPNLSLSASQLPLGFSFSPSFSFSHRLHRHARFASAVSARLFPRAQARDQRLPASPAAGPGAGLWPRSQGPPGCPPRCA